jgi:hypothetical protein
MDHFLVYLFLGLFLTLALLIYSNLLLVQVTAL